MGACSEGTVRTHCTIGFWYQFFFGHWWPSGSKGTSKKPNQSEMESSIMTLMNHKNERRHCLLHLLIVFRHFRFLEGKIKLACKLWLLKAMWNLVLLLSLVPTPHAWIPTRSNTRRIALSTKIMALPMDDLAKTGDEQNPCWEDLYDDDCVMSNAAAANFVASKWIKGLPCGQGLEVRSWQFFVPAPSWEYTTSLGV